MRKSGSAHDIPPPLELECLKALWHIGNGTVKDVREILTQDRNLAYTTVMTVLDRLVKRGTVERQKEGRSFVYTPLVGRDELRRIAIKDLLDSFFDGSEKDLIAFLRSETPPRPPQPVEEKKSTPETSSATTFQPESIDTDLL